jgi:hypothetical protein
MFREKAAPVRPPLRQFPCKTCSERLKCFFCSVDPQTPFPFPVFSSSHSASFRADRECSAPPLFHSATAEPGLGVVLFSFCG